MGSNNTEPAADADTVMRDVGINDAEIARRKVYLEFSAKDVARLVEFHQLIEASGECAFFVDEFYRHLQAFPETVRFLRDPAMLARLKKAQGEYFHSLTAGDYGPAYIHNRIRVGMAHERVGLEPQWYLGAYSKYLSLLVPKVWELLKHDPQAVIETMLALLKVIYLDTGLAIDTYIHAGRQTIQAKATQLAALNHVAVAITSSLDLKDILEQIMRFGTGLTGAKASSIAFYDPQLGQFNEWVMHGLSDQFLHHMAFRPGGLADEAFVSGTHILSNDRPETQHKLSNLARAEGIRGFICLPLTSHAHRLGVIYFYRTDRDDFLPDEIEILTTFASLAAGAIENARLHEEVRDMAITDKLTGLRNRRLFDQYLTDEIARARRGNDPLALLMIDIDHFKHINDTLGHIVGDQVLQTLGRLLFGQLRQVDVAVRYGGEEFVILLPNTDPRGAKLVAERIRRVIADHPLRLTDGREVSLTVSIGIASYQGADDTPMRLVERSDLALYAAKQAGRNRVTSYDDTAAPPR